VVLLGTHMYINISNLKRSDHYKKAIDHRNARHPFEINKLKTRIRIIYFKCKNIAKRKGPCYFSMFPNADRADDKGGVRSGTEYP
jgi:hypothetical protein